MLTISKLKRWSINYYIDTAQAAEHAAKDLRRAGGGLGEYYSEHETRTPVWLLAGDTHTAARAGRADRCAARRAETPTPRWWRAGSTTASRRTARAGARSVQRGVHGFDLTFCAPKSVSLVRALRTDDVVAKAIADAHTTAMAEAMEYLAAACRLHPGAQPGHRGEGSGAPARFGGDRLSARDVAVRGPAPAHPCHRAQPAGPRRRALVSIDGTSLYHEAQAAGVIYQATLRPRTAPVDGVRVGTGRPVDRDGRAGRGGSRRRSRAWSRRSPSCGEWAAHNLTVVEGTRCRRRSWRPRRRPPARPNPKSSPGLSCWSSGAPMRGACSWTAPPSSRRARRGARQRAPRSTGRACRCGREDREGGPSTNNLIGQRFQHIPGVFTDSVRYNVGATRMSRQTSWNVRRRSHVTKRLA